MLRLPPFHYHRPASLSEAVNLLGEHAGDVMPIAGGTDLIPNMKHRLFTPGHLVALKGVPELGGIIQTDDEIIIGAGESLTTVATHPVVRLGLPALAKAAAHVAGPQLRNMATLGGNLCLDTRCTYYNQTEFWRSALGYCLKKDGDVCHVTRVGKKCVAAHSADTPPVLMTMDALVDLEGPAGARTGPGRSFFVADGIWNLTRRADELVIRIRIPVLSENTTTAYRKLRQRDSIDFPLLTVAVAAELEADRTVRSIRGVVTGLGSRPKELTGWQEMAEGEVLSADLIEALSERAWAQCRPLENMIVDPEWRRDMVPVQVRRALAEL